MTNPAARFAYLAGLIDGEGSVHIVTRTHVSKLTGMPRTHYLLELNVFNTDYRLMEWLRDTFGGTIARATEAGRSKPSYRWIVSAKKAAALLRACKQYFIIKRERAAVALAFDHSKIRAGGTKTRVRSDEYFERQREHYLALKALNRRGFPVTANTQGPDESGKRESDLLGDEQSESREASSRA